MALLGSLIKTALDINATFKTLPEDYKVVQEEQLRALLKKAKDTAFGKYHNFAGLLEADDLIPAYQAAVPLTDYDQLNSRWWARQQDAPDITWPGQPSYFALSSGTTGKESKRIPVTDDMLDCFRSVGQSQIAALANFDLPSDMFEKDVLMLSSSADLTPYKNHLEGEISGINSSNIPEWFDGFYKPGKDIAAIDNWDERVMAIAKAAPDWDIVALAGIPSWIRMMLLKVIEVHRLKNIHELWPNLQLYATGGVAFEPHRKSFDPLLGRPLTIMDTYLASEGFFAFTARPGTMNMQLASEHGIFFEFIPFDERGFDGTGSIIENPAVFHLGQVEEDQDYALVISSPAGAWRYMIGDTVKFKDLSRLELVISGRTKYFLNVVGSQLSEEKLNTAVAHLSDALDADISEYAVAAIKNDAGEYEHQWVLGLSSDSTSTNELRGACDDQSNDSLANKVLPDRAVAGARLYEATQILDTHLKSVNKNYKVAREKALRGIRCRLVPVDDIYGWLETKKKKGGQIKVPKVMKTEMMEELLDHLDKK